MDHLTSWGMAAATAQQREAAAERIVDAVWPEVRLGFIALLAKFLGEPLSPGGMRRFELALIAQVRQLGRQLLQATLNALEPEQPEMLPQDLWHECGGYRRREKKTRYGHLATLLGTVVLWRRGYRSWEREEKSIFPLEMLLGLTAGVTPGLADWLGRQMAQAGATQQRVLETLRAEHDVAMGVQRLRSVIEQLSHGMAEFRQANQVEVLLKALKRRTKAGAGGSRCWPWGATASRCASIDTVSLRSPQRPR